MTTTRTKLAFVGALAVGLVPFGASAAIAGPAACEKEGAHVIHEVEEETGLEELHIVEGVYCSIEPLP